MHQPQPVSLMHERRNADCACVCILWIIAERSIINSHKSCWDQIINFFVHFISFVSFSHWFAWLLLVRISRENLFSLQMYFILCARPLMAFFLTFCSVCVCVFFSFLILRLIVLSTLHLYLGYRMQCWMTGWPPNWGWSLWATACTNIGKVYQMME